MSCPDWSRLVAARRAGATPADWGAAMGHLEACPSCRQQAPALDPLLIFRRLPAAPTGGVDLAETRRAVRALRRARELERRAHRRWPGLRAAAALLVVGLLALSPGAMETRQTTALAASAATIAAAAQVLSQLAPQPLVEELDRPGARVYELRDKELSVVMIVDESLDV